MDKRKEKPTKTKGKTNKSCHDEETEESLETKKRQTGSKTTSKTRKPTSRARQEETVSKETSKTAQKKPKENVSSHLEQTETTSRRGPVKESTSKSKAPAKSKQTHDHEEYQGRVTRSKTVGKTKEPKRKTAKSTRKTSESEASEESSESEHTRTEMEKPLSSAVSKPLTKNDSTKKRPAKQNTRTKKVQPTETTEKKTEEVVIDLSDGELEDDEPLANIQKRLRQEEQSKSDEEEAEQSSGTKAHMRYLDIPDAEQALFITQMPGPSHATDAEKDPEESDGEHD